MSLERVIQFSYSLFAFFRGGSLIAWISSGMRALNLWRHSLDSRSCSITNFRRANSLLAASRHSADSFVMKAHLSSLYFFNFFLSCNFSVKAIMPTTGAPNTKATKLRWIQMGLVTPTMTFWATVRPLSVLLAVGRFWQSKNTISFLYIIPNCTERQQYIIFLWSTILGNCTFHRQVSILVSKIPICVAELNSNLKISGGTQAPLPLPLVTGLKIELNLIDFLHISNRLRWCLQTTSICIESTCIETAMRQYQVRWRQK